MANAIEKLFNNIVPSLRPMTAEPWPDGDSSIHEPDPFEDSRDAEGGQLISVEEGIQTLDSGELFSTDDGDGELIEGGVRARGMDVLAFYKSRRFINNRGRV